MDEAKLATEVACDHATWEVIAKGLVAFAGMCAIGVFFLLMLYHCIFDSDK